MHMHILLLLLLPVSPTAACFVFDNLIIHYAILQINRKNQTVYGKSLISITCSIVNEYNKLYNIAIIKRSFIYEKKIENLSMQTQLTVVILSVIVLAFGIILYSGYSGQARSFAEEYTSSTQTILEMDVANLDQYIQGLRIFAYSPA